MLVVVYQMSRALGQTVTITRSKALPIVWSTSTTLVLAGNAPNISFKADGFAAA